MKFANSIGGAAAFVFLLAGFPAAGSLTYWDPQGKGTGGPVSGYWESNDWSTSSAGLTTPVAWVESNAAFFAYGTSAGTPAFTVTMNSSHYVAGVFNGDGKTPCTVTISGSGTMIMPASTQQGFYVNSPGVTTIAVPISGPAAQLIPENMGEFVLNGTNSYSGGTQLGFGTGSASFVGTIGFNNAAAFGTGAITFAYCPVVGLAFSGKSAVTISNAVTNVETSAMTCTLTGNPAGLTFSGPWNLSGVAGAANMTLASGGAGSNVVALSGVISGTNGIAFEGPGAFVLKGSNTYGTVSSATGGTTISSGPVYLANTNGSATGVSGIVLSGTSSMLSGSGSASGTVDNFGVLSATNLNGGTATLTTGSQTWEAGSVLQWGINNATGTAGATPGWDQITINGGMTNNGTASSPLVVQIISLTSANAAGPLAVFDNTRDYSWRVLHSTNAPITGFSAGSVVLNTSTFSNAPGPAVFTASTNNTAAGGDMFVNFVHAPALALSNLTATQGGNAVLYASNTVVGSSAATAVYRWSSNNVPLTDGGGVSGSGTSTLTISNVQANDAATYSVTATNAAGAGSASAVLSVHIAYAVVTWTPPAAITYGTALSASQLNATANLPGTFAYAPASGAVLNSGSNLLTVIFTPSDTIDYKPVTNNVGLIVGAAPLTVTAGNFTRPQGAANPSFSGTIVGLQNGDNITASYNCSASAASPVGTYPIVPSLVDPNNRATNYSVTLVNGTLDVGAIVSWPTPASITYGTALGANQLDATANVPGSFSYTPGAGTILNSGANPLSVNFQPNDSADYPPAATNISLLVTPAALTVTASNATCPAGTAIPPLGGSISGLQNGDNITATYSTTATASSPAGTYPITPSLVDPGNRETNYTVTLVSGSLVITPPPPAAAAAAINLIPSPVETQTFPGTFTLCPSQTSPPAAAAAPMQILVDGASLQTGQYLAAALLKSTGYQFQVAASAQTNAVRNAILITTSNALASVGAEGYELTVAPDSVVVRAPAQAGAFYGVQSLLQLLPPQIYSPRVVTNVAWVSPCVYLQDYPLFPWRGAMLDVARHFLNKDEIKQFLDAMAMHKLNTFHWHLVDDQGWRLEITNYPNLTTTGAWRNGIDYGLPPRSTTATNAAGQYGGYYTQAEAADIVAYAAARHITIVPEIEMPCHSDAGLDAYGQFSCGDAGLYTMDYYGIQSLYGIDLYSLGTPGTIPFLEDVLSETMAIFPGKYIHCGGDEVVPSGDKQWTNYPPDVTNMIAQGISPSGGTASIMAYQTWFSKLIANFIQSKGRMMMGWTEFENGGVIPNAALMDWETGSLSQAVNVAEAGLPVVMSPDDTCYVNYVQGVDSNSLPIEPPFAVGGQPDYLTLSSVYAFNPVPSGLPAQYASNILGAQCNLFGEYVPSYENVMFKMFPRETAMAEILWTPRLRQNYTSFTNRLVAQEQRYNWMGLNYDHQSIPAIGNWANVPTSGSTLVFNVTTNITAPGEIDVSFWWLGGSPLAISSVALLVNGTQVDIDTHSGLAEATSTYQATEPFIPIYTLYVVHLPELVPGATYLIKAVVAGSGGTATSGTIYLPNWN